MGMIPVEGVEPQSAGWFLGFELMVLELRPCTTCDGRGWLFAFSNN
jgi:hypothetical protein